MLFTPLKFRQAQIYKQLLNTHLKKKKVIRVCVCVPLMYRCPQKTEDGLGSPTDVTGGCELPCVWVLWEEQQVL